MKSNPIALTINEFTALTTFPGEHFNEIVPIFVFNKRTGALMSSSHVCLPFDTADDAERRALIAEKQKHAIAMVEIAVGDAPSPSVVDDALT